MDVPTYPTGSRPTIAGLIVSGRLAPPKLPPIGRHAVREDHPQAVTVAELTERVADAQTVGWFTDQTARIQRVALPALDGVA